MRLIDADALKELFSAVIGGIAAKPEMTGSLEHMIRASAMVMQMIDDAQTIDSEQIVRCKDCKHQNEYRTGNCPFYTTWGSVAPDDWFCADGKKVNHGKG